MSPPNKNGHPKMPVVFSDSTRLNHHLVVVLSECVLHAERPDRRILASASRRLTTRGNASQTVGSAGIVAYPGVQRVHGSTLAHVVVITQCPLLRTGVRGVLYVTCTGISQLDRIVTEAVLAAQIPVALTSCACTADCVAGFFISRIYSNRVHRVAATQFPGLCFVIATKATQPAHRTRASCANVNYLVRQ